VNRLRAGPADEVAQRDCPFCCSPVPVKASRCAHCTSALIPA
jgi:large conductance mechanosensitive channel